MMVAAFILGGVLGYRFAPAVEVGCSPRQAVGVAVAFVVIAVVFVWAGPVLTGVDLGAFQSPAGAVIAGFGAGAAVDLGYARYHRPRSRFRS